MTEHNPASDPRNTSDDQNAPNTQNRDAYAPQANPGTGTPRYGDFGHAAGTQQVTNQTGSTDQSGASVTNGGSVAPSVSFPEQRGSMPQNLDPAAVREASSAEYDDQREGWAKDDPRYGSGHRDPNPGDTEKAQEDERNSNVGNNDNPDEFSALRPDDGRGIPGSGK
ncbi:hypothetical protein [Hymenobacter mucosus]|uniref:Uncharacterized protein n=1 Tax=Hymenobacter mucosus TaxID=1411120 RepID=A0A239A704_9BACT|nr:hypothetical protein [Hymenobacter mucosus]SNR91212.1 hypothetical protein SAMN06269173_11118 [Hymenobacter mucosus]